MNFLGLFKTKKEIKEGISREEAKRIIDEFDAWIKDIKRKFSDLEALPQQVNENTDNIQHCYELIYELKDQVEELKQEINALKLIQIINLKRNFPAEKKP